MNTLLDEIIAETYGEVDLHELLQPGLQWDLGSLGLEAELAGHAVNEAISQNRILARQIGWGKVVGGKATPIPQLATLLGLAAGHTEADLAQAIARWQTANMGRPGDGKLGPLTWSRMLRPPHNVIPTPTFKPASWPVFFGGRQLGVLDKTAIYRRCFFDPVAGAACRDRRSGIANEGGGAQIEMGFRVTDMDAVTRAGFVLANGEDNFRWIQVVTFITVPVVGPPLHFIRRDTTTIDPTTLVGANPDPHPYYWDWLPGMATPAGFDDAFNIRHFLDRQATNNLNYDLIFSDQPRFPLSVATPGRRAYFNFETALVGVRPGNRNVILNTVLWGFDIFIESGQPNVDLNARKAGKIGGSDTFRKTLSQAIQNGHFPGHCFAGKGFARAATCT